MVVPVRDLFSRLSLRILIAASAACLLLGAFAGWNARNPDAMSYPIDPSASVPALWMEPNWKSIPKQANAEEQLRYALFQAPADEWAPAFLAVAGNFRDNASSEAVWKAYLQLARVWYRESNLEAMAALESELSQGTFDKDRYRDLVDCIHTANLLRRGDLQGAVKAMTSLVRDEVPHMYDPGLVELNLEVCSDAMTAANRAGNEAMRDTFQGFWTQLVRRLYRIERPGGRPAARAIEKKAHSGSPGKKGGGASPRADASGSE
jgi:hypothetical protein